MVTLHHRFVDDFSHWSLIHTDTSTTHYFKSKTKSTRKDISDASHLGASMEPLTNGSVNEKPNLSDKNTSKISASYRPLLTKSDSIHDLDCELHSLFNVFQSTNFIFQPKIRN